MKLHYLIILCGGLMMTSCVSKKKFTQMQADLQAQIEKANKDLTQCKQSVTDVQGQLTACEQEKNRLKSDLKTTETTLNLRQEQINDLKGQVTDLKTQRDKQLTQVGDLTVLSQSANQNVKETLSQLEKKDKYIHLLQAAKSQAESINLALAVNLKGVLAQGIEDKDVEV